MGDVLKSDDVDKKAPSIALLVRWVLAIVAIVGTTAVSVTAWMGLTNTVNTNHQTFTVTSEAIRAEIKSVSDAVDVRRLEIMALSKRIDSLEMSTNIDHSDQLKIEKAVMEIKTAVEGLHDDAIRRGTSIDNMINGFNELKAELRKNK